VKKEAEGAGRNSEYIIKDDGKVNVREWVFQKGGIGFFQTSTGKGQKIKDISGYLHSGRKVTERVPRYEPGVD